MGRSPTSEPGIKGHRSTPRQSAYFPKTTGPQRTEGSANHSLHHEPDLGRTPALFVTVSVLLASVSVLSVIVAGERSQGHANMAPSAVPLPPVGVTLAGHAPLPHGPCLGLCLSCKVYEKLDTDVGGEAHDHDCDDGF